jgi:GT2 family glycosyltransferase
MKLGAKYHFIVNPDIYFEGGVTPMVQYMADDMTIGMMMPQVLNEDGSVQNLPVAESVLYIEKENKNHRGRIRNLSMNMS